MTKATPQELEVLADRIERAPKIKNREICFMRSDAGYESICRAFYPDHLSMIVQALRFAAKPTSDDLRYFVDEVIDDMPDRSDYTPEDVRARFSIALAARATKSDGTASAEDRVPEAVTVAELAEFLDDNGMLSSPDGEIHIARRVLSRFDVRRR